MRRPLPSFAQTQAILGHRRTRPPRAPPPAAGRALAPTLKRLRAQFGTGVDSLALRWVEIVGEALARRCEPVRLVRARAEPAGLEIRVSGPSAAILQHQAPDILARVNLVLGPEAVGRLRIIQGPVRPRPEKRPPPPRRTTIPLDAALERRLEGELAHLPEGPLKQALHRLGRGVLRRP
jgi:hypothetical protein